MNFMKKISDEEGWKIDLNTSFKDIYFDGDTNVV